MLNPIHSLAMLFNDRYVRFLIDALIPLISLFKMHYYVNFSYINFLQNYYNNYCLNFKLHIVLILLNIEYSDLILKYDNPGS